MFKQQQDQSSTQIHEAAFAKDCPIGFHVQQLACSNLRQRRCESAPWTRNHCYPYTTTFVYHLGSIPMYHQAMKRVLARDITLPLFPFRLLVDRIHLEALRAYRHHQCTKIVKCCDALLTLALWRTPESPLRVLTTTGSAFLLCTSMCLDVEDLLLLFLANTDACALVAILRWYGCSIVGMCMPCSFPMVSNMSDVVIWILGRFVFHPRNLRNVV